MSDDTEPKSPGTSDQTVPVEYNLPRDLVDRVAEFVHKAEIPVDSFISSALRSALEMWVVPTRLTLEQTDLLRELASHWKASVPETLARAASAYALMILREDHEALGMR